MSWTARAAARDPAHVSNPAEVEAFVDGMMGAQLQAHHIAGAAVALVKDGQVVLAKGYGFSDVARRRPVDADRTLFRIGSVTKIFVWTAVMQMVESNELDLDRDVNEVLGSFRVPDTYPEPVTLRHLMSHTAGFEDRVIGLFARRPRDLGTLERVLARRMPRRVLPPGQVTAYSNYGVALAAYIVARVSGLRWEDYVRQRILDPLAMHHTTMRQPIPRRLRASASKGYAYLGGRYRSRPSELVVLAPAGSASASATDMARFMIAHLEGGGGILRPSTARQMREPIFSNDPRVGSMLHGFYEIRRDPVRAIGHGGDTFLFHSLLMLLPEQHMGLFVSYNSEHGAAARTALLKAFFQRTFPPYPPPLLPVPQGASKRVHAVAGTYLSTRRPYASPLKLAAAFQALRVREASGGRITVEGPFPGPIWMVEQEPYVFRETLGDRKVVFRIGGSGLASHAFFDHAPAVAFVRSAALDTRSVQVAVILSAVTLFGSSIVLAVLGWWRRHSARGTRDSLGSAARVMTFSFSLLFLSTLIRVVSLVRDQDAIVFGMPPSLRIALWLPVAAVPFLIVEAGVVAMAWKLRAWSLPARSHRTVEVLVGSLFIAWLVHWNLFGA